MEQIIGARDVVCSLLREGVEIVGAQLMEINDGSAYHSPVISKHPVGSWTPSF